MEKQDNNFLFFFSKLNHRPSEFNSKTLIANINLFKIEWAEFWAMKFETAQIEMFKLSEVFAVLTVVVAYAGIRSFRPKFGSPDSSSPRLRSSIRPKHIVVL